MPYIAFNPESLKGKSVGSGQCVAFVEKASKAPVTTRWRQGIKVVGNSVSRGAAIATFQLGRYQNNTQGLSHAAIYLRQSPEGIYVLDQWNHNGLRQVVHERLIHFRDEKWKGKFVDNAINYYVIE